jgi:UDP-N-acetylmuramate dehydrogenase
MKIQENFSLKNFNTLGIEVSAKYFVEVYSNDELKSTLSDPSFKEYQKLILGGGSNILFTKNFDGIIIKLNSNEISIIEESENEVVVKASAGVVWHELVLFCVERNFGGIENLSLIPGTVGAAPIQNIGAYGQEIKDTFKTLKGIFTDNLKEKTFQKEECDFGYRNSIFKSKLKNKFIITDVSLTLSKHPALNISYGSIKEELNKLGKENISVGDVSRVICDIRRSKLPDPEEIGNAGSFFKNPEVSKNKFEMLKEKYPNIVGYKLNDGKIKIPAGWLIEQSGLKGKRIGNTGTHVNQALVIVNYGNATGEEIIKFKDHVKNEIVKRFGIELEEEVNVV